MKLTTKQAALLSVRERQLIESKGPWQVKQLAGLIRRTRELRDKQQQQIQRQTIVAVRGGTRGPGEQSARSQEKAQVFDRALQYFETELHQLNTESTSAQGRHHQDARQWHWPGPCGREQSQRPSLRSGVQQGPRCHPAQTDRHGPHPDRLAGFTQHPRA